MKGGRERGGCGGSSARVRKRGTEGGERESDQEGDDSCVGQEKTDADVRRCSERTKGHGGMMEAEAERLAGRSESKS